MKKARSKSTPPPTAKLKATKKHDAHVASHSVSKARSHRSQGLSHSPGHSGHDEPSSHAHH